MGRTWEDTCAVLSELAARLDGSEVAALAVTGQGDGTWLIDEEDTPVAPAILWLDARAAQLVEDLRESGEARAAFAFTGTGLAACQQPAQLLSLDRNRPDLLERATTAFHCKDWLYLKLTGVRATDLSEASFSFGDYRTRSYRKEVLEALGLTYLRRLLPPHCGRCAAVARVVRSRGRAHGISPSSAGRSGLFGRGLCHAWRRGLGCRRPGRRFHTRHYGPAFTPCPISASSLPTSVARPRIEAIETTGQRLSRTSISGSGRKPVRKGAHRDRDGDVFRGKEGELAFPIQTSRRDRRVRQPVERDVVEDVVSRKPLTLTVKDARDESVTARVVVEHPGCHADRRIPDPVKRLRAVHHLLSVAQAVLVEKVELIVRMPLVG
jgi:hypothetical protein